MSTSAVANPDTQPEAISGASKVSAGEKLARSSLVIVAITFILTTLAFGGAHRSTTLWATIALAGAFVLATIAAAKLALSPTYSFGVTCWRAALWWLLIWSLLQPWIAGPIIQQHPILGQAIWFRDIERYQMALRCIVLAILTTECVVLLSSWKLRLDLVCAGLIALGTCVAVISLVHWLYDNGKLFFVFSPDYVASQQRARWPFVNSNHLATFLLIPFALSASTIMRYWNELVGFYQTVAHQRIELLFASRRAQKLMFRWGASSLATILIGTAILASFSRANWIAAVLIVFGLIISPRYTNTSDKKPKLAIVSKRSRRRSASMRANWLGPFGKIVARVGVYLTFAAIILFLLNEQGVELFQSRIEYSLLAAKDDIRWQLYRDSWQLFAQHIFLGLGLGSWHTSFSEVMNPMLSGLDAEFLHSDPLQLVFEIGLIGFVPFALALLGCVYFVAQKVWRVRTSSAATTRAVLIGVIATMFVSSADFPFRMLSIQFQTIVCVGLLLLSAPQVRQNA